MIDGMATNTIIVHRENEQATADYHMILIYTELAE